MIPPVNTLIGFAVHFALIAMSLTFLAALYRLFKGPTMPDRLVVVDLISSSIIGLALLFAIITRNIHYVNVAVTIALIGFMGNVAFANYLKKSLNND